MPLPPECWCYRNTLAGLALKEVKKKKNGLGRKFRNKVRTGIQSPECTAGGGWEGGTVVCVCNPSTREVETRETPRLISQPA